jgi:hypothetical protein
MGLWTERGHAGVDAPVKGPHRRAKGAAETQPWFEAGRAVYFGQACRRLLICVKAARCTGRYP